MLQVPVYINRTIFRIRLYIRANLLRMERRRSIVRINAYLFHNINLATLRPRICSEIIVAKGKKTSKKKE